MVMWLWVGGVVTAFGALLAAVPSGRRRRRDPDRDAEAGLAALDRSAAAGASTLEAGRADPGTDERARPSRQPVGVGE